MQICVVNDRMLIRDLTVNEILFPLNRIADETGFFSQCIIISIKNNRDTINKRFNGGKSCLYEVGV